MTDLSGLYARRFSDADAARQGNVWRELVPFLQRYVPADGRVLDVACDRGAFINFIVADDKWAVDVRDVKGYLDPEVHFVQADGLSLLEHLPIASFDSILFSNYLEHLQSADVVVMQLKIARELLKPGGRLIVLQPNIRLVGGSYWDFLDHKTALTDKSLVEAGETAGLETADLIKRFVPYTTKSRWPKHRLLVRLYLKVRPAWLLLGRQTLYVGRRPTEQVELRVADQ